MPAWKPGEILIENPWGVLAYRDELNGRAQSLTRRAGRFESFYLQGYDGNQAYTFDRIGRGRNLQYPLAVCLSFAGRHPAGQAKAHICDAVSGGAFDDA